MNDKNLNDKIERIIEIVESMLTVNIIEETACVNEKDFNECKAQIFAEIESGEQ